MGRAIVPYPPHTSNPIPILYPLKYIILPLYRLKGPRSHKQMGQWSCSEIILQVQIKDKVRKVIQELEK